MEQVINTNTTKAVNDSIKVTDTTAIINNAKTVILVQEKAEDPVAKETDWTVSLVIPIIIVIVGGIISYFINKNKTDAEIKKIKGETNKTDAEIQKLITENEKLKKSFQPIVIATLQSIQDKIVPSKIDALKILVHIKNEFTFHEQEYFEGDPIVPDRERFLDLLFYNFSYLNFQEFSKFHDDYSYLFPDNVFSIMKDLQFILSRLNENKKYFNSMGDPDLEPSKRDRDEIEKIINLFDKAILAIRKDCHLDTSFIHDFIEQNK